MSSSPEVEAIQKALNKVNIPVTVDGIFGGGTEAAVKLFQENYQATNSTHPNYTIDSKNGVVDQYTLLGLDEALIDGWKYIDDEMDKKWLTVPKGSLTFDSEGSDAESSPLFTRKPHIPNNKGKVIDNSGITIGRGLDIGSRTASEVSSLFGKAAQHARPISAALLNWLKGGAGKKKQEAFDYWKTLDESVPKEEQQITRKMQHYLFLVIYSKYAEKTRELTTKPDVCKIYLDGKKIDWDALPDNVKEVLTDLTYRGDYTESEGKKGNSRKVIIPAVYKDQQEGLSGSKSHFYTVMRNNKIWIEKFNVDGNRYIKRQDNLK